MSGSSSDWDPVRAWLATVAGTSSDVLEATSASALLGRRIREITGTLVASNVQVPLIGRSLPSSSGGLAPPPTFGTTLRPHREAQVPMASGGKHPFISLF